MSTEYVGIKFPFSFNSNGGVQLAYANDSTVELINGSIAQLLLTKKFGRTMEPHLYSEADSVIFNSLSDSDKTLLSYYVNQALKLETRIEVKTDGVVISEGSTKDSFVVNITYLFKLTNTYHNFSIELK